MHGPCDSSDIDQALLEHLINVGQQDYWQDFIEKLRHSWSLEHCALVFFRAGKLTHCASSCSPLLSDYNSQLKHLIQQLANHLKQTTALICQNTHCYPLPLSADSTAILALSEPEPVRLDKLLPFVTSALQLEAKLQASQQQQQRDRLRIQALLGQFRLPVAYLDSEGKLMAQNDLMQQLQAQQLESQTALLTPDKQQLAVTASQGEQQLSKTLARLASGQKVTLVAQTDQQTGHLVYALSNQHLKAMSEAKLVEIFGLTGREARCAYLLVCGHSPAEIADIEERSLHTIREQLRSCYAKTGTQNQLQLASLLCSLPAI